MFVERRGDAGGDRLGQGEVGVGVDGGSTREFTNCIAPRTRPRFTNGTAIALRSPSDAHDLARLVGRVGLEKHPLVDLGIELAAARSG